MAAVGDDCYFFCTSTCAKGAACPFRHVESAKTNKIICQHWQTVGCFRPMCKFRHSDFHIQVNYSEIPCYWESQPIGCSKPNCAYKHSKPRPDLSKTAAQAKPNSPDQKDSSNDKTEDTKKVVDEFVMPTVKPVIIDPESEASNSSPVKKPPTKESSEEGKGSSKETESADGAGIKNKGDKTAKVVGKKRKAGALTQKNGKLATSPKVFKKVKKNVDGGPATKAPVKRKMVKDNTNVKPVVPAKMKVKNRLGIKPVTDVSSQKKKEEEKNDEDESSSSSDSDDSIENVKVLSMEEIFRQKALESMMKKRAAEGKPMLPEYNSSKQSTINKSQPSRPAVVNQRPNKPVFANKIKKQSLVKKKAPTPPPPQESESEEGEEDEDEEVQARKDVEEEEDDESSSSESESSSSESSESEDEVRRVVINLDAEKTAREKAKASLTKKNVVGVTAAGKTTKRRKVIRDDAMSLSRNVASSSIHQRLGVKDRLGSAVISREIKTKVSSSSEEEKEGTDENESDDHLSDIKIKSLEELQQERLSRLGNSPIKDRLGPSKTSDVDDEEEEKSGRQILLSEDVPSPKKVKRRSWSSGNHQNKTTKPAQRVVVGDEDQRTVSATSHVENEPVEKLQIDEPESPFESLRRRAFLKKSQELEENAEPEKKDDESEDAEEVSGKRKKHKHKHKHKKHKKSKSERQIYVPPGKKSVITEVLERVKKVSSLLPQQDDIPEYDEDCNDNKPVSSSSAAMAGTAQPRPKPRAAAMWAAGLSVSSKGLGARPPVSVGAEKKKLNNGDDDHLSVNVPIQKPSFLTSKMSNSSLSSTFGRDNGSSVPVVKTFSQIMAEKRQKRQQAQESGAGSDDNSSSPSRMSSNTDSSRPRVPITPIRFDCDGKSKVNPPQRAKPSTTTSILNRGGPSHSPTPVIITTSAIATQSHKPSFDPNSISSSSSPSSFKSSPTVPISDLRPTYKTARAKKLFNKKAASKTQLESTADAPTHIPLSSVSADKTSSSTKNHQHHHRRSVEDISDPGPVGDAIAAFKSPTDGKKHRRASTTSESNPKQSNSMEDEFSFFDGGEDIGDIIGQDVEPIDDLLQDIDDLLA